MKPFASCPSCSTHIRADEASCPFCGTVLEPQAVPRTSSKLAAIATMVSVLSITACGYGLSPHPDAGTLPVDAHVSDAHQARDAHPLDAHLLDAPQADAH